MANIFSKKKLMEERPSAAAIICMAKYIFPSTCNFLQKLISKLLINPCVVSKNGDLIKASSMLMTLFNLM